MKRIVLTLFLLSVFCTSFLFVTPVFAETVPSNPWGYTFDGSNGTLITNENIPANFCTYFSCIGGKATGFKTFWAGRGYVVQCGDGMFSKSGGIGGSCSKHRGEWQTLYAHKESVPPPTKPKSPTINPGVPFTGSDPN